LFTFSAGCCRGVAHASGWKILVRTNSSIVRAHLLDEDRRSRSTTRIASGRPAETQAAARKALDRFGSVFGRAALRRSSAVSPSAAGYR
jgi:hypothetical protein